MESHAVKPKQALQSGKHIIKIKPYQKLMDSIPQVSSPVNHRYSLASGGGLFSINHTSGTSKITREGEITGKIKSGVKLRFRCNSIYDPVIVANTSCGDEKEKKTMQDLMPKPLTNQQSEVLLDPNKVSHSSPPCTEGPPLTENQSTYSCGTTLDAGETNKYGDEDKLVMVSKEKDKEEQLEKESICRERNPRHKDAKAVQNPSSALVNSRLFISLSRQEIRGDLSSMNLLDNFGLRRKNKRSFVELCPGHDFHNTTPESFIESLMMKKKRK